MMKYAIIVPLIGNMPQTMIPPTMNARSRAREVRTLSATKTTAQTLANSFTSSMTISGHEVVAMPRNDQATSAKVRTAGAGILIGRFSIGSVTSAITIVAVPSGMRWLMVQNTYTQNDRY